MFFSMMEMDTIVHIIRSGAVSCDVDVWKKGASENQVDDDDSAQD